MSSSDKNIRKPTSRGLNKDELAAQHADEDPIDDFTLFSDALAEPAAEATAANLLAPEEEEQTPAAKRERRAR